MNSLLARLERLEKATPAVNQFAGWSDDDLTVTLLEIRAALLRQRIDPEQRAGILAEVQETRAEMAKWAAYWAPDDVALNLPRNHAPALIGKDCGERPEHVAKRPNLRTRAESALREIERIAA